MRKIIYIAFVSVFIYGCSKKETNNAPSNVSLMYPTDNLLCINNSITFDWSDAIDGEDDLVTYTIVVATDRSLTNVVQEKTVNTSQTTIVLNKSVSYYWNVTPMDDQDNIGEPSATFAFFTKGDGEGNAAPFSAGIESPELNQTINAGAIELSWVGADSNTEDVLSYEVFFGEDVNPSSVATSLNEASYSVTVETGKTYYWKVNTTDNIGATAIGQVWSFSVN